MKIFYSGEDERSNNKKQFYKALHCSAESGMKHNTEIHDINEFEQKKIR
jgi:hypothetical protein